MDYNQRMELRNKKYNILMEQFLDKIFDEMGYFRFMYIYKPLSRIENWLHWKREELVDEEKDTRKYKIVRWLQAFMWAIPFLSMKKGFEIVSYFENLIYLAKK